MERNLVECDNCGRTYGTDNQRCPTCKHYYGDDINPIPAAIRRKVRDFGIVGSIAVINTGASFDRSVVEHLMRTHDVIVFHVDDVDNISTIISNLPQPKINDLAISSPIDVMITAKSYTIAEAKFSIARERGVMPVTYKPKHFHRPANYRR